jgi:hypothetical protein
MVIGAAVVAVLVAVQQDQSRQSALTAIAAATERARKDGCAKAFWGPESANGTVAMSFHLATDSCARILGTTVSTGVLGVVLTDGPGTPERTVPSAHDIDTLYCPPASTSERTLKLTSSDGSLVAATALECPRKFDDVATGMTEVARWVKERYAVGCREVLSPPKTYFESVDITTTLVRGACAETIAATGLAGNDIALSFTTPLGEATPAPKPATSVVWAFCAKEEGPHPGVASAALSGPFSSATVVCPRAVVAK